MKKTDHYRLAAVIWFFFATLMLTWTCYITPYNADICEVVGTVSSKCTSSNVWITNRERGTYYSRQTVLNISSSYGDYFLYYLSCGNYLQCPGKCEQPESPFACYFTRLGVMDWNIILQIVVCVTLLVLCVICGVVMAKASTGKRT